MSKPKQGSRWVLTGRFILGSFLLLLLFVFVTLLTSTSKLLLVLDVPVKMRIGMLEKLESLTNESVTPDKGNSSFTIRALQYKTDIKRDFELWKKDHGLIFTNSTEESVTNKSNETVLAIPKQTYDDSEEYTNTPSGPTENVPDPAHLPLNILGNFVNASVNKRQSTCDNCFEHDFKYVINNTTICNLKGEKNIDLIIVILTTHSNVRARNALRQTWLTYTEKNTRNIRYVFLLGETKDEMARKAVLGESAKFNDIIKEDFIDSYKNLTYKTIMGLRWATTYCSHARFLLKTDDDMFVNIPNLMRALLKIGDDKLKTTVIGACNQRSAPIRNKKSKWFASSDSYPDRFYPGFCSGTGYATSVSLASDVFKISPHVPFFHLEDVYVSLCVRKLGYKLQAVPGFNAGRPRFDPCLYKGDKLITAHQLNPVMLQLIWRRQCVKPVQKVQVMPRNVVPKEKEKT